MWSWNGDKAPAKPPGEGCQIFESLSIATSDVLTITTIMDEEYILRWNDHGISFFALAEDLLQQELLTDVTVWCGDRVFDAHRLVLCACSPLFRAMLTRTPPRYVLIEL